MLLKPVSQLLPRDEAGRKIEHEPLLFIDRRNDLVAVQLQESLHRRVGDPLVAVEEQVIEREREAQRGGFGVERRVQVRTAEGGPG